MCRRSPRLLREIEFDEPQGAEAQLKELTPVNSLMFDVALPRCAQTVPAMIQRRPRSSNTTHHSRDVTIDVSD
jgi:hypothetical protein